MQIGVRYDLYLVNEIHSHYGNTAPGSGDYDDEYTVNLRPSCLALYLDVYIKYNNNNKNNQFPFFL